jgi:hypothetical protein
VQVHQCSIAGSGMPSRLQIRAAIARARGSMLEFMARE